MYSFVQCYPSTGPYTDLAIHQMCLAIVYMHPRPQAGMLPTSTLFRRSMAPKAMQITRRTRTTTTTSDPIRPPWSNPRPQPVTAHTTTAITRNTGTPASQHLSNLPRHRRTRPQRPGILPRRRRLCRRLRAMEIQPVAQPCLEATTTMAGPALRRPYQ